MSKIVPWLETASVQDVMRFARHSTGGHQKQSFRAPCLGDEDLEQMFKGGINKLLSINTAAELSGLSEEDIERWIKQGVMRSVRRGRRRYVRPKDFVELIDRLAATLLTLGICSEPMLDEISDFNRLAWLKGLDFDWKSSDERPRPSGPSMSSRA